VLLLSGKSSASHFKKSMQMLEKLIPKAKHVSLGRLDHMALYMHEIGGNPAKAVPELKKFLLEI
jgi:hypothetical protein